MNKRKQPTPIVFPCGIQDAANYCGLSVAALKYHVHIAGNLTPRKIGHTLVFDQAMLDTFKANRRAPGRPALADSAAPLAPGA